ncbi:hypothetical protein AB0M20_16925, partial [Actinoplanes sp. NPDC051633]
DPPARSTRAAQVTSRPPATPAETRALVQPSADTPSEVPPPSPPRAPENVSGTATPSPTGTAPPIEVGAECDVEGRLDHTGANVAVKCVRGEDGTLRWQLA